ARWAPGSRSTSPSSRSMSFSSARFLVFLAALLALLALPISLVRKKRILVIGSCLFYAAWDWRYLGLLGVVSVIDFVCAARIDRTMDRRKRRLWLLASIASNLAILGYFKYADFFVDNLNGLLGPTLGRTIPELNV